MPDFLRDRQQFEASTFISPTNYFDTDREYNTLHDADLQ